MQKIVFVSLVFLMNCNPVSKKPDAIKVSDPHKSTKIEKLASHNKIDFVPDIKINDLEIENPTSIVNAVGSLKEKIIDDQSLPHAIFSNIEGNEKLRLVLFPGASHNDIYQFKLGYDEKNGIQSSYTEFVTESGIKLGLDKKEIIKIKGEGFKSSLSSELYYEISNYESSEFLKKYNLPVYFARYTFDKNEKLKKIHFGFEYP